jgi:hypothetical protein
VKGSRGSAAAPVHVGGPGPFVQQLEFSPPLGGTDGGGRMVREEARR